MSFVPSPVPRISSLETVTGINASTTADIIVVDLAPVLRYVISVWGLFETGNASSYIELYFDRGATEGILERNTGSNVAIVKPLFHIQNFNTRFIFTVSNAAASIQNFRYGYTIQEFVGV